MHRTRVKICGIRSLEAALTAVDAGADALGFVFYGPSPRAIEAAAAASIIDLLPPLLTTVGLFVDADRAEVEQAINASKIDLLQFHGNETEAFCNSFSRPYIKAVRVASAEDINSATNSFPSAKALLLDTFVAGTPGGTGQVFDWSLIPTQNSTKFILAGGLHEANVVEAIKQIKPYAVDVSGGVESATGVKSSQKIVQFMKAVSAANVGENE